MIKFFSTGHLSRYIVIFFLFILFWIPAIINPTAYNSTAEPVFLLFLKLVFVNQYFPLIIALLIGIFTALFVNQLATDFEFSGRFSSLAMFFFLLVSSSIHVFYSFNPIIFANIFILLLLKNIFQFPHSGNAIPVAFNSGLLIGIASLFFPPLLILLFFLWGAIFIHRLTNWRNFVVSLIGIILPYLFLFTWYLWAGSVAENAAYLYEEYFYIPEIGLAQFSFNYLIIIYLFVLIAVSALNTLGRLREKNINLRRNLMITVLYLSFVLVLSWYYYKLMEVLLLVSIPAALLLANSTFQSKKMKLLNITVNLLFGLIFLNLYFELGIHLFNK